MSELEINFLTFQKPCKSDLKFRVLSYNILAQNNLTGHQNLYRGKPHYLLNWDYRWAGIQREVQTYNLDIVTLQEGQFSGQAVVRPPGV